MRKKLRQEFIKLTNLAMTDGSAYTVVVSNYLGSVTSSPAMLMVNPAGISLGLYPGVTVDGVVGKTYGIESTLDVNDTNSWIAVTNLTLTQPVQVWIDSSENTTAPGHPQRFYRVVPIY